MGMKGSCYSKFYYYVNESDNISYENFAFYSFFGHFIKIADRYSK